ILIMISTFFSIDYLMGMLYVNVFLPFVVFTTVLLILKYTFVTDVELFNFFIYTVIGYIILSVLVALLLHNGYNVFPGIIWEGSSDVELRLTGWYGNPNRLASIIGVSLVICSTLYLFFKVKYIKALLFIIAFLFISSLLSGSRGVLISVFVVLMFNL